MLNDVRRGVRRASRHMTASLLVAVVSITATGGGAVTSAQDTASPGRQTPPRLVLGEVYRAAERQSPRAAAARAAARAAGARVASEKLPPDPQLQLGLMNYTLPGLEPMDPLGMTQLQLMQMVPTAGKLRQSGRVAAAQAAAAGARAADVEWEVRNDVAMAFYDLYATDHALAVARETLRLLQDLLRTAESMYRVGEGRQADVLRAQLEIARMTEDTLRMRAMRVGMAGRLNALLDRPADTEVPEVGLPRLPEAAPAPDSLLAVAMARRPMLRAGEADVRAAGAAAGLARREIWPDLQLGVAYGQRSGEMGVERMGSLMVGASLPVFARQRQLRMRDETAAMRQMAEADLAAMRADTRGAIVTAHASLTRAKRLAVLYRGTVIPQAEATVASALAAYRVGTVDFMTLLDARMAVNGYRQELTSLEGEEGKAWAELEMLIGGELFDPDVVVRETADGGVR